MDDKVKEFLAAAVPCKENVGESTIRSLEFDHIIRYRLFKDTVIRVVTRKVRA